MTIAQSVSNMTRFSDKQRACFGSKDNARASNSSRSVQLWKWSVYRENHKTNTVSANGSHRCQYKGHINSGFNVILRWFCPANVRSRDVGNLQCNFIQHFVAFDIVLGRDFTCQALPVVRLPLYYEWHHLLDAKTSTELVRVFLSYLITIIISQNYYKESSLFCSMIFYAILFTGPKPKLRKKELASRHPLLKSLCRRTTPSWPLSPILTFVKTIMMIKLIRLNKINQLELRWWTPKLTQWRTLTPRVLL